MSNIIVLLNERLTVETRWILAVLLKEEREIPKQELWQLVNEQHGERINSDKKLIATRHFLDNFINRLEGAALVNLTKLGPVKLYSISDLGKQVLHQSQNKGANA